MRRHLAVLAVAVLIVLVVARVWAEPPRNAAEGFQGYWMGVDHVDGGDSRRSLVQLDNGKFALARFNNGATVVLHVRYELVGKGLMIEHTTRQDGSPVSSIVFHKVSQD